MIAVQVHRLRLRIDGATDARIAEGGSPEGRATVWTTVRLARRRSDSARLRVTTREGG